MVKFINEQLFKMKTSKKETRDGKTFYATSIQSMIAMPDKRKGEGSPMTYRTLVDVSHDLEDDFNKENTRVYVDKKPDRTRPILKIYQGKKFQYDSDIYMIAVPYCGLIQPIENSFDYRIYRAFTAKAAKRTIEFNGCYYNRIAYMAISPNFGLLKDDHKYHKDKLELKITTYNIESINGNRNNTETIETVVTLSFSKDEETGKVHVNYHIDNNRVDPINVEEFSNNKEIFPIFQPTENNDQNGRKQRQNNNNRGSSYSNVRTPENPTYIDRAPQQSSDNNRRNSYEKKRSYDNKERTFRSKKPYDNRRKYDDSDYYADNDSSPARTVSQEDEAELVYRIGDPRPKNKENEGLSQSLDEMLKNLNNPSDNKKRDRRRKKR